MRKRRCVLVVALVVSVLALSACNLIPTQPTEAPPAPTPEVVTEQPEAVPTAVVPEAPKDVQAALDAALAYVADNYGDQAPSSDLAWVVEFTTPEDIVGSGSYRFTADKWVITISYPVVAPDATIYTVVMTDHATGFQWEGEVDAAGQVTEGAEPDVAFEGVSFSYDDSLAAEVRPQSIPSSDMEEATGWEVVPEHKQFSFSGYILPDTFHQARIMVYSVGEYEALNPAVGDKVASLKQLLAEQPATADSIPFLPTFYAEQMIRSQVAYFDFNGGTGVRFLTHYSQASIPVNNQGLFYTFQGLTDDGAYYVAAILPVSNPILPADGSEIPGGDLDAFAADLENYMRDIEQQLNAQAPDSFTPDLVLLDEMIQSLEVVGLGEQEPA